MSVKGPEGFLEKPRAPTGTSSTSLTVHGLKPSGRPLGLSPHAKHLSPPSFVSARQINEAHLE